MVSHISILAAQELILKFGGLEPTRWGVAHYTCKTAQSPISDHPEWKTLPISIGMYLAAYLTLATRPKKFCTRLDPE